MDDRIRPEHHCSAPAVADSKPGTTWTCPTCRARYTVRGESEAQSKKPRSRIWGAIVMIADSLFNLP